MLWVQSPQGVPLLGAESKLTEVAEHLQHLKGITHTRPCHFWHHFQVWNVPKATSFKNLPETPKSQNRETLYSGVLAYQREMTQAKASQGHKNIGQIVLMFIPPQEVWGNCPNVTVLRVFPIVEYIKLPILEAPFHRHDWLICCPSLVSDSSSLIQSAIPKPQCWTPFSFLTTLTWGVSSAMLSHAVMICWPKAYKWANIASSTNVILPEQCYTF